MARRGLVSITSNVGRQLNIVPTAAFAQVYIYPLAAGCPVSGHRSRSEAVRAREIESGCDLYIYVLLRHAYAHCEHTHAMASSVQHTAALNTLRTLNMDAKQRRADSASTVEGCGILPAVDCSIRAGTPSASCVDGGATGCHEHQHLP